MRREPLLLLLFTIACVPTLCGQTLLPYIEDPAMVEENKLPARTTFHTADRTEEAGMDGPQSKGHYLSLDGTWKFNCCLLYTSDAADE